MTKNNAKKSKEEIVQLTLDLAVQRGWDRINLNDIAEEAGLDLAALHEHFEDKTDILTSLGRIIDRKVLENIGEVDESVSVRDRLFDVLMERYDVLNEFRPGLIAVLESFKSDPKQAVISLPHLCRSMSWMMEAAGLHTDGLQGALKVTGLTAVYIKGLKSWKDDESPDLAKVMAVLDKDLGRAEQVANMFAL